MVPNMDSSDGDSSDSDELREVEVTFERVANPTIQGLLRAKYNEMLIPTEDGERPPLVALVKIFKPQPVQYVPGLRPSIRHPKLSALTRHEQANCLKVLCGRSSHVLPEKHLQGAAFTDYKIFEALREVYAKEQKEYAQWAKFLWVTEHCKRALQLNLTVEKTYEAEFKMRAQRLDGFPIQFMVPTRVPLKCSRGIPFDMQRKETLIPVNLTDLPEVELPEQLDQSSNIIRECTVPKPCKTHPTAFILPNEDTVSMLAISELHSELAQFAVEKGAQFIASENALRCLVQHNRYWIMPISVCPITTSGGEHHKVVVLGSEFFIKKEMAMMRTYRAFKHLLEDRLIPHKERERVNQKYQSEIAKETCTKVPDYAAPTNAEQEMSEDEDVEDDNDADDNNKRKRTIAEGVPPPNEPKQSSADEENNLVIIIEDDSNPAEPIEKPQEFDITTDNDVAGTVINEVVVSTASNEDMAGAASNDDLAIGDMTTDTTNDIQVYSRTCIGTPYKVPPTRSFVRWDIKDCATAKKMELIIHCVHKARENDSTEIILEPMPEYQLDLGGSEQPVDRVKGIVLALLLRQNASVLNVRLDGCNGDMIRLDKYHGENFLQHYDDIQQQVVNSIYAALSSLQQAKTGNYVLQHRRPDVEDTDPSAMLFLSWIQPPCHKHPTSKFNRLDSIHTEEADETMTVVDYPTISPVLLPFHKYRMQLPCSFTTDKNRIVKQGGARASTEE